MSIPSKISSPLHLMYILISSSTSCLLPLWRRHTEEETFNFLPKNWIFISWQIEKWEQPQLSLLLIIFLFSSFFYHRSLYLRKLIKTDMRSLVSKSFPQSSSFSCLNVTSFWCICCVKFNSVGYLAHRIHEGLFTRKKYVFSHLLVDSATVI